MGAGPSLKQCPKEPVLLLMPPFAPSLSQISVEPSLRPAWLALCPEQMACTNALLKGWRSRTSSLKRTKRTLFRLLRKVSTSQSDRSAPACSAPLPKAVP